MIVDISKTEELITLYEHMYAELRAIADEKIVVLKEIEEIFDALEKIQDRLDQLYEEKDHV